MERIRRAQTAHIQRAVAQAARLAGEAAEMTEEGIRDIFDEDAESDAAVQAALVRQTSDRAMHAVRRVNELRSAGRALAFGHTADQGGQRLYIGRLTVMEGDEPLLVDWRAPAAVPFYQATPLKRMGVERRRNFLYGSGADTNGSATNGTGNANTSTNTNEHGHANGSGPTESSEVDGGGEELVSYSDELFDVDAAAEEIGLRGEAALLASVTAPTRDQMRSVVATIQAEQDAVIRAAGDEPLVVQGGPGTGKTVVALHRAAYLLYAQREALSDTGVLIIGPTSEFLTYIAGVLPSLGETGVLSVTAPELYPGVRRGAPEDDAVALIKGRIDMATLLANGVKDRQRRPQASLNVWYGARRVTLGVELVQDLFDRARQYSTHNEGADFFRFEVIEALTDVIFDPSFHNREDGRGHFRRSEAVAEFLLRHWPPLTPEQALNDLLGSAALCRSAARGTALTAADLAALHRDRAPFALVGDVRWSNADIPLLDELLALVGISLEGDDDDERTRERDELDEFERAEAADLDAETGVGSADPGDDHDGEPDDAEFVPPVDELFDGGLVDRPEDSASDRLVDPMGGGENGASGDGAPRTSAPDRTVREADNNEPILDGEGRAIRELDVDRPDEIAQRSASVRQLAVDEQVWRFGHVIVDEAQDLTPMQWRMVVRRSRRGSVTMLGDLAQRSVGEPGTWDDHLPPEFSLFDQQNLTTNYRSPAEINDLAGSLLDELAPDLPKSRAVRRSGQVPSIIPVGSLETDLAEVIASLGNAEVPVPPAVIGFDLPDLSVLEGAGECRLLSPWKAKGLEFDSVVVVEPARFLDEPNGLSLLYVALTRSTNLLTIVHQQPLPDSLRS